MIELDVGLQLNSKPKADQSNYVAFRDNPINWIDPDGGADNSPDWYTDNETGDVVWFEGSGHQEGYTHEHFFYNTTDVDGNSTFYDGVLNHHFIMGNFKICILGLQ